jgi:putative methyltransferase (TIGR04325 family)
MKDKVTILKNITPPILWNRLKVFSKHPHKYGFCGNYLSWEDAKRDSIGYDSNIILEKVKNSLLKIKNGEAVYERDSVLFDEVRYSWPLLAALLLIAGKKGNSLNIIDFGGSLGSTYYQNLKYLSSLNELRWNIIEQENFVTCGKKNFEDKSLKFYYDINSCLKETQPNSILFSGSLQYVENPFEFLSSLLDFQFEYILFDRTTFVTNIKKNILTVQKVPPSIYEASYPCWLFNKEKFLEIFKDSYLLWEEFESYLDSEETINFQTKVIYQGFIFKKL